MSVTGTDYSITWIKYTKRFISKCPRSFRRTNSFTIYKTHFMYVCFSVAGFMKTFSVKRVVVQSLSSIWLLATPRTAAHQASHPSLSPRACSNSCPLMSDAIQPFHPLSSPSSPAFSLSHHQGLFKWVSSSHQVFSFNISPSSEHPGLISFSMGWLDLSQSNGLSRDISNTTVQKHQIFGTWLSL